MGGLLKIKDVADKYDVTARTLRYYEEMGLLHSVRSEDYAYRLYDDTAVKKIEQILILRKLNISIRDIQRIFHASGSEVVLEVLGKKVRHIDDEVALLHELKAIVQEFIQQIEQIDFGNSAAVRMLYDKAKDVETHLATVEYIGKPSNVNRLLDTVEKLERQPDIVIVDMPPCRMVTSGPLADGDALDRFNAMWMRLAARIADKINPRDFMYEHWEGQQLKERIWLFLLEDWITEADTEGYAIITFDGGLFAAATADGWEFHEYERVYHGIKKWLTQQEHLALDEGPERHLLFHFTGPHSEQMKAWNYGKVRYFVPIKVIGGA